MITIYDVLRRPLVTEKSNYQVNKLHQYVFEVAAEANKTLIKDAVEKLFKVTVVRVNVLNAPAKRTRRARSRRMAVRNNAYKKAIVTLLPEDRLPMFEGVE
jgi:large subunit ribosomal protein L23